MFFFNRREQKEPAPIRETVETFQELAKPLVDKGDIAGVQRLFSQMYADLLKKAKGSSVEELRAKREMEKALEDALARPNRERRRYFKEFGASWWRRKRTD